MANDMVQALNQFSQQLNKYAVTKALQNANAQVQQIRESELNEVEQQQSIRQVAQNLGVQMAMGQADPRQIQIANQLFQGPMQDRAFARQAEIQRRSQEFSAQQQEKRQEQQEKMFEKREALKIKKEKRARMNKMKDSYVKNIRSLSRAEGSIKNIKRLLEIDSPMAISALGVLMARGSGEVGNLSEAEQSIWRGRRDWISRLQQAVSTAAKSQVIKDNKEAIMQVVNAYQSTGEKDRADLANQLTGQLSSSSLFTEDDPNALITQITGGQYKQYVPLEERVQPQVQGPMQQAAQQSKMGMIRGQKVEYVTLPNGKIKVLRVIK